MFDSDLAQPLVSVICDLLNNSSEKKAECIMANVKRNPETYCAFITEISKLFVSSK